VLRCHSDQETLGAVRWSRRVAGEAGERIIDGCDFRRYLKPTLSSVYSLITDGTEQCDLVVNRINSSLTGLYICTEVTGQTAEAYLTIIGQLLNMLLLLLLLL